MYVMIRRSKLTGPAEEAARRTRDHIVPPLEGRPGFRGHCALVTEEFDAAHSVGVFDDRDAAMDAHRRFRQQVETELYADLPLA